MRQATQYKFFNLTTPFDVNKIIIEKPITSLNGKVSYSEVFYLENEKKYRLFWEIPKSLASGIKVSGSSFDLTLTFPELNQCSSWWWILKQLQLPVDVIILILNANILEIKEGIDRLESLYSHIFKTTINFCELDLLPKKAKSHVLAAGISADLVKKHVTKRSKSNSFEIKSRLMTSKKGGQLCLFSLIAEKVGDNFVQQKDVGKYIWNQHIFPQTQRCSAIFSFQKIYWKTTNIMKYACSPEFLFSEIEFYNNKSNAIQNKCQFNRSRCTVCYNGTTFLFGTNTIEIPMKIMNILMCKNRIITEDTNLYHGLFGHKDIMNLVLDAMLKSSIKR